MATPSVSDRAVGRVVVVEEFPETTQLLGGVARNLGVDMIQAKTTPELMGALGRDRPDLMVLDVGLADVATTKLIQFLGTTYPEVPIVAVAEDRQAALLSVKAGAHSALRKPLEPAELTKVLRSEFGLE